jgi:tRNA-dihydrouridine synthase B
VKIGAVEFKNNVFLSPMAGVTDIPFRVLCKEMGCALVFTEMVSAKGLQYKSRRTEKMLEVAPAEKPIGVQLFGNDPAVIAGICAGFNANDSICLIDINMGCPVRKVVNRGEGAALMKDPALAVKILSEAKKASNKPVTVKFRKGFDEKNINGVEFAKEMEQAGADALVIHGRTRQQLYSGKADWEIIKKIKESVSVPVIGNGDIFTHADALRMLKETGCDGVMVGRGALGNPWIFREILQALAGAAVELPTEEERADMFIRHLDMAVEHYGGSLALRTMNRQFFSFMKGRNKKDFAAMLESRGVGISTNGLETYKTFSRKKQ